MWDGRFANNGWMQEAPDPMTQARLGQRRADESGDGRRTRRRGRRHRHPERDGANMQCRRSWCSLAMRTIPFRSRSDTGGVAAVGVGKAIGSGAHGHPHVGCVSGTRPDSRLSHAAARKCSLATTSITTRWRAGRSCARPAWTSTGRTRRSSRRSPRIPELFSLYSEHRLRPGPPVGHGDRPQRLHRLQRLHGRLPGREQHPDRRQGAGAARPRDALDPHRPLLRRRRRTSPQVGASSRCRASSARTRRARRSARSARRRTAPRA